MGLLYHKELKDETISNEIGRIIKGYFDEDFNFIQKRSFGIAKIATAFYPNEVIVRFSDFRRNEYFNLLEGKYFKSEEEASIKQFNLSILVGLSLTRSKKLCNNSENLIFLVFKIITNESFYDFR